ncbi:MAG: NAD(P)-dependent oxidoreductase [Methylococcaceae bacterium]|nr:NAD(P)-dependent oxidoreductase [Methylococcaceae bacterium]
MKNLNSVLVTGATSQIGVFLLPRLVAQGFQVHAISRNPPSRHVAGGIWHAANIVAGELPDLRVDCIIHLAPLPLLPALLPILASHDENPDGLRRVIAFGSTSRFTKQGSTDPDEREFANLLEEAEDKIARFCEPRGIAWTVFRPTLIYGCGKDKNISTIARFIRKFGFFPLIGGAKGLRIPVHAEDLAAACLAVMGSQASFNHAYNLSGGEILCYREMVERIFQAEGKKPVFLRIPLVLFSGLIVMARLFPHYRHLSVEMAKRMTEDLCFDHADAKRDFNFVPRRFEPPKLSNLQAEMASDYFTYRG